MAMGQSLKKIENRVYGSAVTAARRAWRATREASARLVRHATGHVGIVIVRPDEKPPIRLSLSRAVMGAALLALAVLVVTPFVLAAATPSSGPGSRLERVTADLGQAEGRLAATKGDMDRLEMASRDFKAALQGVLAKVSPSPSDKSGQGGGALDRLFGAGKAGQAGSTDDIDELIRLLNEAAEPVSTAGARLDNIKEALVGVPSVWPLKGGIGYLTNGYGTQRNPFTGQPYFHRGIDVSLGRSGDPIVATADGYVAFAGWDGNYGNNVILINKHGFVTRFGHMSAIKVRRGQNVTEGTVIGLVGATGLVTGPHVHYELFLGGKLANPLDFVDDVDPSSTADRNESDHG